MITLTNAPRHILEGLLLDQGYAPREINSMSTRRLRYIVWHVCEPDRGPEDFGDFDCVDDYE